MATATAPKKLAPAAVPEDLVMRFSVKQYHQMIASGFLNSDTPVELLEGFLVYKMPKNPPHRVTTRLLRLLLDSLFAERQCYVETQEPITLADSEPEPDLAVVRGDTLQYLERHPEARDAVFVVEVADATLARDRKLKKRIYAQAGIASYWIVNLVAQQVEVYTLPGEVNGVITYQSQQNYRRDEFIPVFLDGVEIGQVAVSEVLPQVIS
ncbi:MAG: Uma2 family endonuclease [Acidobacteria bacterium]|nr:Uma2 family endonuclease [Acidobacteriota bacterium]